MASKELIDKVELVKKLIKKNGETEEYADGLKQYGQYIIEVEHDREYGLECLALAKHCLEKIIYKGTGGGTWWDLEKYCFANKVEYKLLNDYYKILLIEAQNMVLDSYFMYLERKREPKERFYMPKRKQFLKIGLTQALQDMLDDKLDLLSISLPPGTGKSTIEKFFHSGVCGWFPEEYSLFFSHSAGITRMYYDGILSIMTDEMSYTWKEIFPECAITSTNAKMEQICVNSYKSFPNVQTASVGSEMAGKVRASKFLFVDDLIGKIEEALNKNTLDKLWNVYSTDALQRKTVDNNDKPCKEIHIATRWSVADIIGRIKNELEDDPRAKFIAVPDIDPDTGESNFKYEFKGMDEEFFHRQEKFMDEISYRCLYKNDPIEREGLLYEPSSTRTYITLPDRDPDAILGVCDTKSTGKDYMVLTVFYQYDSDFYLVDCICDDSSDFGEQQRRLSQIILDNNMQQCEFESNAGGSRLAVQIADLVTEQGGRCNITTKPTETNKETRIIVNSDWIKKNCLFKDKSLYVAKSDYGRFMGFMYSYSVTGKNKFDDVVDCLANFSLFITGKYSRGATVQAIANPLWRRRF